MQFMHTRRLAAAALFAAAVAMPVHAQERDGAQVHELLQRLEAVENELREMVDGLTEAQWTYKPAADRWSVAEVVEHIILAEKSTWETLTTQLREADVSAADRQMAQGVEGQIAATLQDRTQRFPAPPDFEPTGRWGAGADVMGMYAEVRGAMNRFLREADFDLRTRVALNPITQGDMDAHGWTVIAIEHNARHNQQIKEVMEDAGYPGR